MVTPEDHENSTHKGEKLNLEISFEHLVVLRGVTTVSYQISGFPIGG